jgi:DNA-binding transcriptional LysR family regulator
MNLKALQTFHLVVREGSLAAAAAKLHLSPPAVSRLIRILEDETRLTLFSRARRRLSLTTEGELFFREAQHILEGVGEIPRIASDIRRRALAGVRVITSAPLAVSLVSPALAKLRAAHPLIRCVADIGSRFDLESMVGTRRYDLGIVSLPISHSLVELDASPLCRARAVAVMPASHPLAARARVTARDLRAQPMIALRPGRRRSVWRSERSHSRSPSSSPAGAGCGRRCGWYSAGESSSDQFARHTGRAASSAAITPSLASPIAAA